MNEERNIWARQKAVKIYRDWDLSRAGFDGNPTSLVAAIADALYEQKTLVDMATRFVVAENVRTKDGIYPFIAVEKRSDVLWCVFDGVGCLTTEGHWEVERQPSSRTDEFIARTRFPLEVAILMAREFVERNRVHETA